jgi:class 3 adenylate cyclase
MDGGLALRAAMEVGPVLLGNLGSHDTFELAALGEVAERLEQVLVAGPGEILLGQGAFPTLGTPAVTARLRGPELEVARAD